MEFAGAGLPLTDDGLLRASARLEVGPPEVWAILKVESRGWGFLADRRPKILFERHVFHRETDGRFDGQASDVSAPTQGGYGTGGAHQYDRLAVAIACDRPAALRSASWGLGQVMGFHAARVGFADVEEMVRVMASSEDAQLGAMAAYIRAEGLHRALQSHDWTTFARGYNGPDFAANEYDTKLAHAYASYRDNGPPALRVRTAQLQLVYRSFDPGPVDGDLGVRTRTALRQLQIQKGLAVTGEVDDPTFTALTAA